MTSPQLAVLIGVTGHRDLRSEDEAPLRQAVGAVLDAIRGELPHSPLTLLTPLAEGSDRLVADEALRRGFALIAPLPMPLAAYETEFASEASRDEFRTLLARAERSFELPLAPGVDPEKGVQDARDRGLQYQQLGAFLVRHAQILIALWDGADSEDNGGTAHVVRINLEGPADDEAARLDPWDRGPCYHVVTPRVSNPEPSGEPFATRLLFPESDLGAATARERHRSILSRIDLLNREIAEGGARLAEGARRAARDLLPPGVREEMDPKARELLALYATTDALASRMQRRYRRSLAGLLLLVLLALAGFEAYDNLLPEEAAADAWSLALLAAYPAALGLAFLGYWLAQRREYQDKHLDYRALCEGIRVQLFWRLVGLPNEVADHYLRKQSGELRWIHEATRVSNLPTRTDEASSDVQVRGARWALEHWVRAQRAYFVRSAVRDARGLRRSSRLATFFYVGSLATTLVLLSGDGLLRLGVASAAGEAFRPFLFMAIALLLGLSVLVRAYSEKMGFSEQALQYQRMRDLFLRAEVSLERALARREARAVGRILLELGEEALQENADWVLFRRSRGIEIPQG